MKAIDVAQIDYRCFRYNRQSTHLESIHPIGIDTEADRTGECFMIATSLGDVFLPVEFPGCLFSRKYRGQSYVCYNLKYDMGAFLQRLPLENLQELRSTDSTEYAGFRYKVIGYKCLTIRRGKNSLHFYDMLSFYGTSLNQAAKMFLNEHKLDLDPKSFDDDYIRENWAEIAKYCIQDAKLVEQLANSIIERFESYGVKVRKLYSIAYVSYQYFRTHTPYVVVKRYWQKHREVLQYALWAYNGGKFEVTQKGPGYYYEYDIVSAYPSEIRNLIDISWARVVRSNKYRKGAIYAFLKVKISIPFTVFTTTVVKRSGVNCYMVGDYETYITKAEFEYLTSVGCDISILDGYWIHCDNRQYPYRREIDRLTGLKARFKEEGKDLDYHTIKILMNSFYGKMLQLVNKGERYEATSCWNPIYGTVITANTRIMVSHRQQAHPSIVAVHTDSVLSTEPLDISTTGDIGTFIAEEEGQGIILGAGIYQVGDKVKFRGLHGQVSLMDAVAHANPSLRLNYVHAYTWKEIAFRSWPTDWINLFDTLPKKININFDQKRLWLDDWHSWDQALTRNVESCPWCYSPLLL